MSKNYDYALALIENDVRNDCEYYVYSRLRDVVDGLENDNESLTRLLKDALEKKYSKEDELQAENAKLRELVQDMHSYFHLTKVQGLCQWGPSIMRRIRDLGIEVDA